MPVAIIVVEDDADLRYTICAFLEAFGFDVRGAADAVAFDGLWRERPADILVLDINLPGEDGFSIAARVRAASSAGIVMMTARGRVDDRVSGFEVGADNYMVKPVVLRELVAVIKGLARRLNGSATEPAGEPWSLDPVEWAIVAPNSVSVPLTAAEFSVLEVLMASPGRPVTRGKLLEALGNTNRASLDSLLSRLRRKVAPTSGLPLPIKSVRAVGYVFTAARGPGRHNNRGQAPD